MVSGVLVWWSNASGLVYFVRVVVVVFFSLFRRDPYVSACTTRLNSVVVLK